jgi:hypothetical protein
LWGGREYRWRVLLTEDEAKNTVKQFTMTRTHTEREREKKKFIWTKISMF